MPQTINGIGTTYYGKADLRQRPGECEFCGRRTTIESYTTRYWFVIIFIPIIPLGRKRILDQCGVCRMHRAVKLAEWEEARAKAMEEGMRKVVDQPGTFEPQAALLKTCLVMGEWEKADQLVARIREEFAQDPKAHLLLASAHAYRGRAAEASQSFQKARELDPALVKESEEAAASRPAPKRPGRRRQWVLLGILGAIILGGLLIADWTIRDSRRLYVANGYGEPLTFRIDDRPEITVLPQNAAPIELPEGRHTAHVGGPLKADIPFEMSSYFMVRVFESRAFVLNPGGRAVLVREETLYAEAGSKPSKDEIPPFQIHYGKPFETFSGVDYSFQSFPHEISLDKGSTVRKSRVDVVRLPLANVVRGLMNSNREAEALSLAEWALDAAPPSDPEVVAAYAEAAANPAYHDRVLNGLKSRLGRRPVEIALHREYQNFAMGDPKRDLVGEYEAALKAEPGNSALLYLRGRLASGIAQSLDYFERATAADPANAFAHGATAHCRSAQGKWSEALSPAVRACELDPTNTGFQMILDAVRLSLGQYDPLEKELRGRCDRSKWAPTASLAGLVNLLAFRKDLEGSIQLCDAIAKPRAGADPKTGQSLSRDFRCRALYASGDFAALAAEVGKGDPATLASHRFAVLVELGKLDEAEALAKGEEPDAFEALERSIAWFMKGDAVKAGALRKEAAELLRKSGNREMQAAADLLSSAKPPDPKATADLDIAFSSKAIVLTALAQAHPEAAPELVRQAKALNTGLAFPRYLLGRALTGLEPKR
jgi:tetratricopeptide (TPR) repeat protein